MKARAANGSAVLPTQSSSQVHWVVPTYHRIRALSFAYAFVFCGVFAVSEQLPSVYWVALALQFLVYPQVLHWRASRSAHPQQAALNNLLIDMLMWGLWTPALHFQHWICFTLVTCSAINIALNEGARGVVRAVLVYTVGLAIGVATIGLQFVDREDPWISVLCSVGLIGYLMAVGNIAYRRTLSLRRVRAQLLDSEAALNASNLRLQERLAEIELLQKSLEEQANRDSLTGLFNRRYLESTLERELARCKRENTSMALLLLDLDHFKQVNDRHGHAAGDEALRQLAALMTARSRTEDVPCRFGGEEFLLLMPGSSLDIAMERAELLRVAFEAIEVPSEHGLLRCTVSIGVASFPQHGDSQDALVRCADLALYAVKRGGRNGVLAYQEGLAQRAL